MYSHEIESLLKRKNYLLSNKEYFYIIDTSPQIEYLKYQPDGHNFSIRTTDHYHFDFKVYQKK